MFECDTCGKCFPAGWQARENHCRSTGHSIPRFECDICDAYFRSEHARHQHMRARSHFFDECRVCNHTEPDENDIKDHEVIVHHYCRDCSRHFQSLNSIRMHLNSAIHRGRYIRCPLCSTAFATAASMTHHVEGGSCPNAPGTSRDDVYRVVRSEDPNGIISKKPIGWNGSPTYEVSDGAHNGDYWECYLCHRAFQARHGLNRHINSPIHQQPLYHCPNRSCGSEFKTLAGIINHLESERCNFMHFEAVQNRFADLVSSNRLINF
ncbi:hypothetical protein B0H63DRAFT_179746 [Podospora didyma]|uniref:C2H2-type domain-containing protein n=1 Tax=Podospora didyma TaxID=330526 RepID=A0AAE0NP45_9PEZI|nr:hypothetical protein B0H63DRAFT_179746 [Podospora didyma]